MIKAIIFDVDNVIVDMDFAHFEALNKALASYDYSKIKWREHFKRYKGKPTKVKLNIYAEIHGEIPKAKRKKIYDKKQKLTRFALEGIEAGEDAFKAIQKLSKQYRLAACSNAIRKSTELMLKNTKVIDYFDFFLSAQDVEKPKPDSEIYDKAFKRLGLKPEECLIIEDSKTGKEAARRSGANLCAVKEVKDVTLERIEKEIKSTGKPHIVIPIAGRGKRFKDAGYSFPKPLIDVDGKPMVQVVVDNLDYPEAQFIFICLLEEYEKFSLKELLNHIAKDCFVEVLGGITQGACSSVLYAEDYFDGEEPLIIANSDQYIDGSLRDFIDTMKKRDADAGMMTFESTHPKWSYAKLDNQGQVCEVKEKEVISNRATVGIYYYRRGRDFIKYARQMIREGYRVKGEFYVAPVFNYFIKDGKKVVTYDIKEMHGLGTPEDLEKYIRRHEST